MTILDLSIIQKTDPEIAESISNEINRQQNTLELIASENIASEAVMATQACVMTNKYAEGYPGARYYGGCNYVDQAESLAIERAKQLFQAEYANVQPHSGSQANMAVYFALLNPGDTVMGMDLSHGGHLTHGSAANFSGQLFNFVHYGLSQQTGMIDHNELADLAKKHRPKLIVAGASAYPRIIDFASFAQIAKSIDAYLVVDMAHIAGLIAAKEHPTPIPHAHVVTTTTHKTLRGPRGGLILSKKDFSKVLNSKIFPGIQGGPLMHIIAAKAVALKEAMGESFINYQKQTIKNATCLAEILMEQGLNLVTGGTDNHLILVDLRNIPLTGKKAQTVLEQASITVNKNAIPHDTESPFVTSGIRIGTPAVTSRGMKENEMKVIGKHIVQVLKHADNSSIITQAQKAVKELCQSFPL
ncbi:MAG: Glycine hydroxymethyltransferase [Candidatus Magnetoglobus multicellularis str. Araruama]|uniref:Serine hydroxymethyltransferase n=1 Tax=Candidatus Magnetoglobus multicellularis str. Araruama TaxID=890399 RepID=A0A1V1P525_9BACT|nr:MAG: Glycine hydroxymethyltransferase [Candidatus Magnetoglobus multicellularis str. Araruama]